MFDSVIMDKVSELLLVLIQIAVLVALTWARQLKKKAEEYYMQRTTKEQREILSILAREAFAFVETVCNDMKGPEKMQEAMKIVAEKAQALGLNIDETDIRAAIEAAWLEDKRKINKASPLL